MEHKIKRYKISGGIPLSGTIKTSGSKNICLAIMAGSILAKGTTILKNIPNIEDVNIMASVIRSLGIKCETTDTNTLEIDATDITNTDTDYVYVEKMRASFNVLGPVLARMGKASVSRPGGCNLGDRPVDFHLRGLKLLGAIAIDESQNVIMEHNGLKGTDVIFDIESVGATQHIMMTACLASGTTIISNAATEPEVTELAVFLRKMGAQITGEGTKVIKIIGVKEMRGTHYTIPFDRIEAGTYAIYSAITKGNIIIEDIIEDHMLAFNYKLRTAGVDVEIIDNNKMKVSCNQRPNAVDISTNPFPGFATDMLPGFSTLMCIANGSSTIVENIFKNRFNFIAELQRMNANAKVTENNKICIITGVNKFTGAEVNATDLRGGAALIGAALAAEGESKIGSINHILRGYEDLPMKLQKLSANIEEIEE